MRQAIEVLKGLGAGEELKKVREGARGGVCGVVSVGWKGKVRAPTWGPAVGLSMLVLGTSGCCLSSSGAVYCSVWKLSGCCWRLEVEVDLVVSSIIGRLSLERLLWSPPSGD